MQMSGGHLLAASWMAATQLFSFPAEGKENANRVLLPLSAKQKLQASPVALPLP